MTKFKSPLHITFRNCEHLYKWYFCLSRDYGAIIPPKRSALPTYIRHASEEYIHSHISSTPGSNFSFPRANTKCAFHAKHPFFSDNMHCRNFHLRNPSAMAHHHSPEKSRDRGSGGKGSTSVHFPRLSQSIQALLRHPMSKKAGSLLSSKNFIFFFPVFPRCICTKMF